MQVVGFQSDQTLHDLETALKEKVAEQDRARERGETISDEMTEELVNIVKALEVRMDHLRHGSQEGNVHATQVINALRKIAPTEQVLYRGSALSRKQFQDGFGDQDTLIIKGIQSSSKREASAMAFVRKNLSREKDYGMLAIFCAKTSREIAPISEIPSEEEAILLPGTRYKKVNMEVTRTYEKKDKLGKYPVTIYELIYEEI